jgi:hypothetical protein
MAEVRLGGSTAVVGEQRVVGATKGGRSRAVSVDARDGRCVARTHSVTRCEDHWPGLRSSEVRPDRSARRRNGKSDPLDAESAARAVLSGLASGTPKTRDARVEMIRVLRVARRPRGRTVRVVRQLTEVSRYGLVFGPPESAAGKRVVPIPEVIFPVLRWLPGTFGADSARRPDLH